MTPRLSWFPVRHVVSDLAGEGPEETWIETAPSFGFSHVEIYELYVRTSEREERVRRCLNLAGVSASMLTCGCDFGQPDRQARKQQVEVLKSRVAAARRLGARAVRVTAGIERAGVTAEKAIAWTRDALLEVAEDPRTAPVTLCLENHFRDRSWPDGSRDITMNTETFFALVDAFRDSPVMVNFDTAQPMLLEVDEGDLLRAVIDRVFNVHAGDRRRGQRRHAVLGEGDVDFTRIFELLRSVDFQGFVSIEDGNPEGDDGLRRGLAFLEASVGRAWHKESWV